MENPQPFGAWLYTITRFKLLESWKRREPVVHLPPEVIDVVGNSTPTDDPRGPPSNDRDFPSLLERIRTHWIAFWMREVEGRSTEEVAKALDILPDAVDLAVSTVHACLRDPAYDDVPARVLLLRGLLDLIRLEFEPKTFQVFLQVAAEGRCAGDVANEMGMTVAAVYTAKSKVLKRLREEAKAFGVHSEGESVTRERRPPTQREVIYEHE